VAFTGTREFGHDLEKQMKAAGYDVAYFCGDMANEQFCKDVVAGALKKWGQGQLSVQQCVFVYHQSAGRHARGLAGGLGSRRGGLRVDGHSGRRPHEIARGRLHRQHVEHLHIHRSTQRQDL
jgi:hypothetical protein